ncbi:hypothetical protein JAAARDRAFT_36792 [Jaapia argillacea MUCL 33604]|uniref:Abscisic acid G-protein coupled receptor-like domain-containing protein n=1 Tax=Jaapia argillacea MUCL 33604 TaxID=933084 RepID=A0A067PXK7_9AGAM|nr:hypothetical protein JAAARDRAFT_36792 [Jaapia argillacea MUCL 33604]
MSPFRASIVPQTAVLVVLRSLLFLACRKYLLQALYHDLQGLSVVQDPADGSYARLDGDDHELETLPTTSSSITKQHPPHQKKHPLHSTVSRAVFSISFSESCLLFILLMCQGLDIFTPRTRSLNWNISLALLLLTILVFVPLCLSLISTSSGTDANSRQRPTILRVLLAVAPVFVFLFLLSYIPVPSSLSSWNPIIASLSRLIVLGTIILGLLSGFGAISTAWAFFPLLSRKSRNHPSSRDVANSAQALDRVRSDLNQRKEEMTRLRSTQPEVQVSWYSRVASGFRGDNQITSLSQEITGLEALEYQMARNLDDMKSRHANAEFSGTLLGKIFNLGGGLFAVYCVFRIISSVINLMRPVRSQDPGTSSPDVITHLLAYSLSLLPSLDLAEEDIAVISRQISLALVGVIILSSIRLVLRGATRALRVTSRNLGASLMLIILAQLMGLYLLATLIQLRTSFPPPATNPDMDDTTAVTTNLFATLPEYQVFGSLFDGSFLLSAGCTTLVLWFDERINRVEHA